MDDIPPPLPDKPVRFMDRLRAFIRSRQLAYKTEKTYCIWILDYIRFHKRAHPASLSGADVDAYLSFLAISRNVSINTQKTALNAIVFLYKQFLGIDLGVLNFAPSSRARTLPVVFSHQEATQVINALSGRYKIMALLMYGAGLRVMETVRLRVQDVDFTNGYIIVRESKGLKWRRTLLPATLVEPLRKQVDFVLAMHQKDIAEGYGEVYLPNALAKKYPRAAISPEWQYLFPADNLAVDPRANVIRRHHIGERQVQRIVKQPLSKAKFIRKRAAIRFATALPRGCWRLAPIYAIFRKSWGTAIWRPRKFTPMWWELTIAICLARLMFTLVNRVFPWANMLIEGRLKCATEFAEKVFSSRQFAHMVGKRERYNSDGRIACRYNLQVGT